MLVLERLRICKFLSFWSGDKSCGCKLTFRKYSSRSFSNRCIEKRPEPDRNDPERLRILRFVSEDNGNKSVFVFCRLSVCRVVRSFRKERSRIAPLRVSFRRCFKCFIGAREEDWDVGLCSLSVSKL